MGSQRAEGAFRLQQQHWPNRFSDLQCSSDHPTWRCVIFFQKFEFYSDNPSAENIFITGSLDSLQSWSPDNALALSSANYPTWSSKSHAFCQCLPLIYFSHRHPSRKYRLRIQVYPQVQRSCDLGIRSQQLALYSSQWIRYLQRQLAVEVNNTKIIYFMYVVYHTSQVFESFLPQWTEIKCQDEMT